MTTKATGTLVLAIIAAFAVTNISAATQTIQFESPGGGEVFAIGQVQKVRLGARTRAKVVTIDISRDGGATFQLLGAIDNSTKDVTMRNVLTFTVTGPSSSNCVLRATGTIGRTSITSTSSPFSIGTAGAPPTGSVTTEILSESVVTTSKLADGSVTNPKLAVGAVSTEKITSGNSSSNFVLLSDGAGGVSFGALPASAISAGTAGINITGNAATATQASTVVNNGVTAAAIANGAVTPAKLAAQPKAQATRTTNQTIPNNSETAISFDSTSFDTDGIFSNIMPTKLTCNTAGVYLILAHANFSAGGTKIINLKVNGNYIAGCATTESALSVSTALILQPGDFVETTIFQFSGASFDILSSIPPPAFQ